MNFKEGTAVFVTPLYVDDYSLGKRYLEEAVNGIFDQTDRNWNMVIIDDCSPGSGIRTDLDRLKAAFPGRVEVILKRGNDGPGYCRNMGIEWAHRRGAPFVLYNDADDISRPGRLERVRRAFLENEGVSVVYSTFEVIDEYSNPFPIEKLDSGIMNILNWHSIAPPQGENAWIAIGTRTGYTNLTSATAVTTDVAYRFPFPVERISEDWHTWVRYSAGGGKFHFLPESLSYYRVPSTSEGSTSRSREGGRKDFYRKAVGINIDGFKQAINLAIKNRKIKPAEKDELLIRFYINCVKGMALEQMTDMVEKLMLNALNVSREITKKVILENEIRTFFETIERKSSVSYSDILDYVKG